MNLANALPRSLAPSHGGETLRVVHLNPGKLYGGVETFLVALARYRHLCPGLHHDFVLSYEGRLSQELSAEGCPVHFVPPARLSRPWTVWRTRRALARLLEGLPESVVIAHQIWPMLVYGPAVRAARRQLVLYLHGPSGGPDWMEWWGSRRRPDRVIGVSRHTLETYKRVFPGVPANLVHYPLPWPESDFRLTEEERRAVRAEVDTPADAVVILQASRMEPWKGQDVHLAALAQLKDVPGWLCWMAGGCQRPSEVRYYERLRRLAAESGLAGRVRFLGERRDVCRLMAAADIYCQGNRGPEGFSLAFLEAFAAGLPIVTSALGGAMELIDPTCGILVPPEEPAALARGLNALITDPVLRSGIKEAARQRVRAVSDPGRQLSALCLALSGQGTK